MTPVEITWPGGQHAMKLALAQLEALQGKCDAGPEFLLNKLRLGHWYAGELFEILRWGLVGGGMDPIEAEKLLQRVFNQHPCATFKAPAMEVLAHALFGPPEDDVGKGSPVAHPAPGDQNTENGPSAPSTD